MKRDNMRSQQIRKIIEEAVNTVTISFYDELCSRANPGQFFMIWVPGVDEVPMSISSKSNFNNEVSVTVRSVGKATKALCSLNVGDRIGIRGPFGNGYTILGESPLLVAGGIGATSLRALAETMTIEGVNPIFILADRSREKLVFRKHLEELLGDRLIVATDDGSCGLKGIGSKCALELMEKNFFDHIYTCGPELMMASVFKGAERKGIPIQVSLERYIKCAVGLCGSCALGSFRICSDGPVFNNKQLVLVKEEFGLKRMDPSGCYVKVDH